MRISTIICTRNRGSLIAATLQSILSGSRQPDELIVIDQSDTEETARTVETFSNTDRRIQYVATQTRGLCLARNLGIAAATGEVIAFTDDDVIVNSDWLARIEQEFAEYPDLALLFGTVLPPDTYDWKTEFIPYTKLPTLRPVKWNDSRALLGMGANMALRKTTVEMVGDFDIATGAGTPITGNDDREYALRVLCNRVGSSRVHLIDEAQVIHHAGARRGAEYHTFVHKMNGTGEGRFWAYLLRRQLRGRYAFKFIQYHLTMLGGFAGQILRGKRPSGAITYLHCLKGIGSGLFAPSSEIPLPPAAIASQPVTDRALANNASSGKVSV